MDKTTSAMRIIGIELSNKSLILYNCASSPPNTMLITGISLSAVDFIDLTADWINRCLYSYKAYTKDSWTEPDDS